MVMIKFSCMCDISYYVYSQAYYNWAIAMSDRAKLHGRTKEAEALWKQVTT